MRIGPSAARRSSTVALLDYRTYRTVGYGMRCPGADPKGQGVPHPSHPRTITSGLQEGVPRRKASRSPVASVLIPRIPRGATRRNFPAG